MFSDPVKIVEQCGVLPGMDVVDLGVGSGHYSMALAKALLSSGRVYAVDVQKEMLVRLKNQANREGFYNIEIIWGDVEKPGGTKLRDFSVDFAILGNTLFQFDDRKSAVQEIKRILKPGGLVAVVDWTDSFGGIGPEAKAVVKKEQAVELFEKAGMHLDKEISAGSHHYGLLFKKL